MVQIYITAERRIGGPAEDVYRYLANYRDHHPHFLPPAFSEFVVEQGGVGEGTIIRFAVTAGGQRHTYRQRVTEPEPGQVLVESGIDSSEVTTFTVAAVSSAESRVRIETRFAASPGLRGVVERVVSPFLLSPMYADELRRLDRYAREHAGQGSPDA